MRFAVPPSSTRVQVNTDPEINERLRRETDARVAFYSQHPEMVDTRLAQLDREWDIERVLELNAATLAFTGSVLAATSSRKWLLLPLAITGFLWQHAVQGWCPPLPLLRALGFRTPQEIEEERRRLLSIHERQATSELPSEMRGI